MKTHRTHSALILTALAAVVVADPVTKPAMQPTYTNTPKVGMIEQEVTDCFDPNKYSMRPHKAVTRGKVIEITSGGGSWTSDGVSVVTSRSTVHFVVYISGKTGKVYRVAKGKQAPTTHGTTNLLVGVPIVHDDLPILTARPYCLLAGVGVMLCVIALDSSDIHSSPLFVMKAAG